MTNVSFFSNLSQYLSIGCLSSFFFFPSVLDEHLGIVPAKSLMTFYAEKMSSFEKGVAKAVCEHTLSRLQSRIVSFEEQVSQCIFVDPLPDGPLDCGSHSR